MTLEMKITVGFDRDLIPHVGTAFPHGLVFG